MNANLTPPRCFPVISKLRVQWDPAKPAKQRVENIWTVDGSSIKLIERGSKGPYYIITNNFLHKGGDGYNSFKGKTNLCPDGGPVHTVLYLNLQCKFLVMLGIS